jgi:hypothetical protein
LNKPQNLSVKAEEEEAEYDKDDEDEEKIRCLSFLHKVIQSIKLTDYFQILLLRRIAFLPEKQKENNGYCR